MENKKDLILAVLTTLCMASTLFIIIPTNSSPESLYEQYFWADINNDGKIDGKDIAFVSKAYGSSGAPIPKAALLYDSGWINITDKVGQDIIITHGLNSEDIMVEIFGKMSLDSGTHQKHLGLTDYRSGWSRTYGGVGEDWPFGIVQTSDGGYAIAGRTSSYGAGGYNVWLVKTDSFGNVQWNKTYGGTSNDEAWSLIQTDDGGYAIVGYTNSFGIGGYDFWLVKMDANGNVQWNKTYGGVNDDFAYCGFQCSDGGYVLVGYTGSYLSSDVWLVKTNASGYMEWNKTYRQTDENCAYSVVQTSDGGYAFVGWTGFYAVRDLWFVKTNSTGNIVWKRTFGGTDSDEGRSLVQTSDGGYALAGYTKSFGVGDYDFWLIKTDSAGNMKWSKTYGGTNWDIAYGLVQTVDGGYALAGATLSYGIGDADFWLVKTDSSGKMQWNKSYGGTGFDSAYSITQTIEKGYVLVGWTRSYGAGDWDFWLVKTDIEFGLAWVDSSTNTITLHRGLTDLYWNFVRVRIWKPKETP